MLPGLHDYYREPDASPQRALMTWANRRIDVLKWQGEVWIPRRDLPRFLATQDEGLDDGPSSMSAEQCNSARQA
ncbi:hypothetical protein [Pseudomonas boanensis]|uniref:hypothetical protein n=1 Tax=Metapseudomonas boanensis TaxID=2822138 RepID=UPI0035D509E8